MDKTKIENVLVLGFTKKAWSMDNKTGISYGGAFSQNGEILKFRCEEVIYNQFSEIKEVRVDLYIALKSKESLAQIWVVGCEKI